MDNIFFTEQEKSRRVGSYHTLSFSLQYQYPSSFLSECTVNVSFIDPHNLMVDKKLFYGSYQYNSCTNVFSYIITEHAVTFPHIKRFKSEGRTQ